MPIEDALQLLSRNFQEVRRGGPSGREAVYALLGQLADGRTLTVLQYDKVIEYLQVCRNFIFHTVMLFSVFTRLTQTAMLKYSNNPKAYILITSIFSWILILAV